MTLTVQIIYVKDLSASQDLDNKGGGWFRSVRRVHSYYDRKKDEDSIWTSHAREKAQNGKERRLLAGIDVPLDTAVGTLSPTQRYVVTYINRTGYLFFCDPSTWCYLQVYYSHYAGLQGTGLKRTEGRYERYKFCKTTDCKPFEDFLGRIV